MASITVYFDENLCQDASIIKVDVGLVDAYTIDEAKRLAKSMAWDMLGQLGEVNPVPTLIEIEYEYRVAGRIMYDPN